MPQYKLTYFNIRGLAEPVRMAFAYGGLEYEDNRIEKENWPELKSSTPLGQMPLLEVDGVVYHQSFALLRYIGAEVGLNGSNSLENLEIEVIAETLNDFKSKLVAVFTEEDEAKKAEKTEKLTKEDIPRVMSYLDGKAADNNGYLAAGKLTWVDLFFYNLRDIVKSRSKIDIVAAFANLQKVIENVAANENISKWIETRPVTEN